MEFKWFQQICAPDDTLEQGDFIPKCPILDPPENIADDDNEYEVNVLLIDSIVLSQSCDLAIRKDGESKIDIVLVCPYLPLSEYLKRMPEDRWKTAKAKKQEIDKLKQGNAPPATIL